MAQRLTPSEISELLKFLENDQPDSLPLCYLLKNSITTNNVWPRLDVYIDNEDISQLTSVLAIWHEEEDSSQATSGLWGCLYTLDCGNMTALIRKSGVLSNKKNCTVVFCLLKAANGKSFLEQLESDFGMTVKWVGSLHSYILDATNPTVEKTSCDALPPNFDMAPLQTRHSKTLQENWHSPDPPSLERFENTIKHQKHLAVYNETGEPVAWAVVKECGDIGMTHTLPSYRRQGLASILRAKLAQMLLESNEIPFVSKSSVEAPSSMYTHLGFKRRGSEWSYAHLSFHGK